MRKEFAILSVLIFIFTSCSGYTPPYKISSYSIEKRVEDLMKRMTLEEKIAQMQHIHSYHYDNRGSVDLEKLRKNTDSLSYGCVEAFPYSLQQYVDAVHDIQKEMTENTRLGIPVIPVVEGLHGVVQDGCTIYPQAIAQGATFNPQLIEEMAYQIALEARSIGAWQILSPCLDVARELRWGRVEETFGEDTYMNSVNGTAYVRGAQRGGVIVTPKHYVAHGSPQSGINLATVAGGRYDLYNIYLPPFKMIIDECAPLSIMNSYSTYDGEALAASRFMLTELLRERLGFKGYIYSDWGSIGMLRYFHKMAADAPEAAKMAIEAGLDLEASSKEYKNVKDMVEQGYIDESYINEAVKNILYAKFKSGLFDNPLPDKEAWKSTIHNPESVELSRQMAVESAVLLENSSGILPLDANSLKSIAVIGPNAARVQFGDYSWGAATDYGTTPLKGITDLVGGCVKINYAEGCDLWSQDRSGFAQAINAARKSDVSIIFAGSQSALLARKTEPATSGEGYDLHSLQLPGVQDDLIDAICETGKPVIVVLVTGRPFELAEIKDKAKALVVQWYAGEKQGEAIADLLFGKENFSGKLPVSFPKSTGSLPCFYNYYPSDKGYYNRKGSPDKPGRDYVFSDPYALYNFGYGLSYSKFKYTDMEINSADDTLEVNVTVRNISDRAGKETVQIYSTDVASSHITPVKKLIGYKKVEILPDEEKCIKLRIPVSRLGFYDNNMNLRVEPGDFLIMAGSSSDKIHHTDTLTVPGQKLFVKNTGSVQEVKSSDKKGKDIQVEILVRDVQASPLEGVTLTLNGKKLGTTDGNGKCKVQLPAGSDVKLTKPGYKAVEVKTSSESGISITMIPEF